MNPMNRRTFIRSSVATSVGLGMLNVASAEEPKPPATQPATAPAILNQQEGMLYRQLGDLPVHLSFLSLGCINVAPRVWEAAIDRGVNTVHVSKGYSNGRSIEELGKVLKTRRDKVYIALKDTFRNIDDDLKTLGTDHIDFLMFNRHSPSAAADEKIHTTFDKLKAAGKVRYAGLTSHGEVKTATAAGIESGMYALVMPSLNQGALEDMAEVLRLAQAKKVGVMAMKTMGGLKGIEMETAFVKKLAANPAITTILRTMSSFDMFDAYFNAAQKALTMDEDRMLYRQAQKNRENICLMCDTCRGVCPFGIEISTVIRCHDYYLQQMNDRELARSTYGELPESKRYHAACADCRKCEEACPHGMKIVARLESARQTFAALA